jgi:broad specificity phosphatase PhoE
MLGDWEGLTAEEIVGRGDAEKLRLYRQDSVQFPSPGSEPLEAMWDRMRRTLDDARAEHSSGSIAIVGHGSSLRVLICEALGAGGDVFRRFVLDNGSVSILEFGGPLSRVRLVNDTSHLAGA